MSPSYAPFVPSISRIDHNRPHTTGFKSANHLTYDHWKAKLNNWRISALCLNLGEGSGDAEEVDRTRNFISTAAVAYFHGGKGQDANWMIDQSAASIGKWNEVSNWLESYEGGDDSGSDSDDASASE
jgi:hypothetical protein